ncbi:iron ABC transporter permease [Corynebacterium sp.]|uniref:FecCD family ABC transporter permease n=1 Tax=Corynebacterium sp. TaxID=1720 RepID=UPI0026DD683F|nr:iron ABC transporter permease [Corynebacterium sp.]MDO5032762.1 iron ABC transporter permease [Corynebacterium sp.]
MKVKDRNTSPRRRGRGRVALVCVLGLVALGALAVASLALGARSMGWEELLTGVRGEPGVASSIIWERRLPRTLVAVCAGSALALAGAVLQIMTRNPLADTGIFGINVGASLAAALALGFLGWNSPVAFSVAAIVGAGVTMALVTSLGRTSVGDVDPLRLILAGVAIGAVCEGISSALTLLDPHTFARIRAWVTGSVDVASWPPVLITACGLAAGVALLVLFARHLPALALGEDAAASLGVNLRATRLGLIAAVTVLAATATAAAGVIVFVGLIIPHIVRLCGIYEERAQLIACAVLGPLFLLGADIVGRFLTAAELPAGVTVALIGAPVLIFLSHRAGRRLG